MFRIPILLITLTTLSACGAIPITVNGKVMYLGGDPETKGAKAAPLGAKSTSVAVSKATDVAIKVPDKDAKLKYVAPVKVEGKVLRLNEVGFKECGDAWGVGNPMGKVVTTKEQVLTIKFKENTPRSKPSYQTLMMMSSDGRYTCKVMSSAGITQRLPAGEYLIYSAWRTAKVNNHKHPGEMFASTGELEVRTMGSSSKPAELTISADVPNPWTSEPFPYVGAYTKPDTLGFKDCRGYITSKPIATIKVPADITTIYDIKGAGGGVLATPDNQKYWCGAGLGREKTWKAGTYVLYAGASRKDFAEIPVKTFAAVHKNPKAPITIDGEIPTYTVRDTSKPHVFQGKSVVRREVRSRDCAYKESKVGNQPDFYLEIDKPLNQMKLRILNREKQELDISMFKLKKEDKVLYRSTRRCSQRDRWGQSLRSASGRYAVFIAHPGDQPRDYTIVLTSKEIRPEPYFQIGAGPGEGLALGERILARNYPLMRQHHRDFGTHPSTRAPAWAGVHPNVLAYVTQKAVVPVPEGKKGRSDLGKESSFKLLVGEPVILLGGAKTPKGATGTHYRVLTVDMNVGVVSAQALGVERPETLKYPKKARTHDYVNSYAAKEVADKRAAKVVASYDKAYKRYNACFDKYWDKNNGSVASKYDRVTRKGGRIVGVKNMGDVIAGRADRKCGRKKIDGMARKRDKELVRSFQNVRTANIKAVRARLEAR